MNRLKRFFVKHARKSGWRYKNDAASTALCSIVVDSLNIILKEELWLDDRVAGHLAVFTIKVLNEVYAVNSSAAIVTKLFDEMETCFVMKDWAYFLSSMPNGQRYRNALLTFCIYRSHVMLLNE